MAGLMRSLRTEFRYQWWSKLLLLPLGVSVLSLGLSFSGSISHAAAALERMNLTMSQAAANGVSLADALSHPVNTSVQGGQQFIDNPLRADYETAYQASLTLDAANVVGTGLEMITFIILPLLFFIYGGAVAVNDVKQRILKQRVTTQEPVPYVAAKVLLIAGAALASVLLCSLLSLLAAPALRAVFFPQSGADFPYPVEIVDTGSPALQIAFSAATATFFGLTGFFTSLATRAILIPALAAGALLMVLPFAGAYDPRNILSVAGAEIFTFWGGFTPRAQFAVSAPAGLLLMSAGLCLFAAATAAIWTRRSKFI